MEFWIYFWIYSFSVVVIWAFFIIAKIHSLKFKNYQPKIILHTNIITILLSVLTVLWYIVIFFMSDSSSNHEVKIIPSDDSVIENKIDDFSDISEKDDIIPDSAWKDYY